ncbi:MAG: DUF2505 family protein [Chrysiogenetes bacterium]|nr:DUF2505 family protein [Chrysiogenetes bacterium]
MQEFEFRHCFPLPPIELVNWIDDSGFRRYLIEHLGTIRQSDRLVYEDSPTQRRKIVRVYPDLHLPAWIERALKHREPYFEMNYVLDKETMIETVSGEARIGKLNGKTLYEPDGRGGTIRRFKGSFECEVRLVGRAVERFYMARMAGMYDREADLTQQYIDRRSAA